MMCGIIPLSNSKVQKNSSHKISVLQISELKYELLSISGLCIANSECVIKNCEMSFICGS